MLAVKAMRLSSSACYTLGCVRALLILNPNSTSITPALHGEVVKALRSVRDISIRAEFTAHAGHAADMVRGKTVEDFDVIIPLGGDGTVNEIVNGLLGNNPFTAEDPANFPAVAIIPTGSANVLAGSLGIPRNPIDAAWAIAHWLREEESTLISVGHAADRCFCVNAGVGIDAEVIAEMEQVRSTGSKASVLRYLPTIYDALVNLRKQMPAIDVTIDGELVGENLPFAVVANTNPWVFLGDLPVVTNPDSSVTGGVGFYGVESLYGPAGFIAAANFAGALTSLHGLFRVGEREIRVDDADEITLHSDTPLKFQLDGEYVDERTDLDIKVRREAIRMVAPEATRNAEKFKSEIANQWLPERIVQMNRRRLKARAKRLLHI